jgi:hypothetical protein
VPVSLHDALGKIAKITNPQPLSASFNTPCDEIKSTHEAVLLHTKQQLPQGKECLKWFELMSQSVAFSMEYHFYLKE